MGIAEDATAQHRRAQSGRGGRTSRLLSASVAVLGVLVLAVGAVAAMAVVRVGDLEAEVTTLRSQSGSLQALTQELDATSRALTQQTTDLAASQAQAGGRLEELDVAMDAVSDQVAGIEDVTSRQDDELRRIGSQTVDVAGVVSGALPSVVQVGLEREGDEWIGSGSGFALQERDPQGRTWIVTNHHVIAWALEYEGLLTPSVSKGDTRATAEIIDYDADADLALLSVAWPGEAPPGLPLAAADDTPAAGQPAIAIGNPASLADHVTVGIISSVDDTDIRTDAAINPGNSGGPLLDRDGRVVGVVKARVARMGDRDVDTIGIAARASILCQSLDVCAAP